MVLLPELKIEVTDPSRIYEEHFDQNPDQSAIYEKVHFIPLKEDSPAIVLTPVCDIGTKGADCLTVARIIPIKPVFEFFLYKSGLTEEEIMGISVIKGDTKRNLHSTFQDQYLKNRTARYHFLPGLKGVIDNSFVSFEMIQTIHYDELKKIKKIAVLKSPWRESVPARYAAYCLRIGTPDYSASFFESVLGEISFLKTTTQIVPN